MSGAVLGSGDCGVGAGRHSRPSLPRQSSALPACTSLQTPARKGWSPGSSSILCPGLPVLIPARNEEKVIEVRRRGGPGEPGGWSRGDCPQRWFRGRHGRTGRRSRLARAATPRVRLLAGPPLPAGWCGKQHACWVLAWGQPGSRCWSSSMPTFAWERPKGLLARLVGVSAGHLSSRRPGERCPTSGNTYLAGVPGHPGLQFTSSCSAFCLLARGCEPSRRSRLRGRLRSTLLLTTRDGYEKMGTHAVIRTSLHDGITLPSAPTGRPG